MKSKTHKCPKCGDDVPNERQELLGIKTCVKCTKQKKKPVAEYDYPSDFHKGGSGAGGIIIVDKFID